MRRRVSQQTDAFRAACNAATISNMFVVCVLGRKRNLRDHRKPAFVFVFAKYYMRSSVEVIDPYFISKKSRGF